MRSAGLTPLAEFFFDMTGAAFLHGAAGDTAGIAPPLVVLSFLVASYVFRERAAGQDDTP